MAERGLALVSVLWGLSILSLIAVSLVSSGSLAYRLDHNEAERVSTELLMEAALQRAVLGLLDPRPEARWRVDGVPVSLPFGGARVTWRIQDELGKVDLNAAEAAALERLLLAAGAVPEEAELLARRIEAWRRPADERILDDEEDYLLAGYEPRRGPFQSIEELRLLAGMSEALFERVAPALTVHSQRPQVDPASAPELVLRALPGLDDRRVTEILEARGGPRDDEAESRPGRLGPTVPLRGRAFGIEVETERGRRRVSQRFVVRLTESDSQPYWLLARSPLMR